MRPRDPGAFGARNRFVSVSRDRGQAEAGDRRAWLLLLGKLREISTAVLTEQPVDRLEAASVAGLVIQMKAPFPLRYPSAGNAAEALLTLARGFVAAGWPRAMAGFVAAGVDCLDAMLVEDGHRLAQASRRMIGERDE